MSNTTTADPYAVLQIPHDASPEQVKRAYRRLLLIYHPDKQHEHVKEGDERLIELTDAYRILMDPASRAAVDRGDGATGKRKAKESAAEKRARNPTRTINLEEFIFHPSPPLSPATTNASPTTEPTEPNPNPNPDPDSSENEEGYYTHPCRCSGSYKITIPELEEGVDVVGCEGCGEWVGVGYEVVEDEEGDSEAEE